jgi:hypothetical protein
LAIIAAGSSSVGCSQRLRGGMQGGGRVVAGEAIEGGRRGDPVSGRRPCSSAWAWRAASMVWPVSSRAERSAHRFGPSREVAGTAPGQQVRGEVLHSTLLAAAHSFHTHSLSDLAHPARHQIIRENNDTTTSNAKNALSTIRPYTYALE